MLTTILDLIGIVALAIFAWLVWPPLPLLVVALSCFAVSRKAVS